MSDFDEDLKSAEEPDTTRWLESVYRAYFGEKLDVFRGSSGATKAQSNGVDVTVHLVDRDKHIRIDEKVRSREFGDDVLLEVLSNYERRTPGWLVKPLTADFIANAYPTTRRCELLPVLPLRRAWRVFGPRWYELAKAKSDGFRLVDGTTTSGSRTLYHTHNIAVPRLALLAGIGLASGVEAQEEQPLSSIRLGRPGPWGDADWAEIMRWAAELDAEAA